MSLTLELTAIGVVGALVLAPLVAEIPVSVQMLATSVGLIALGSERAARRERLRKAAGGAAEPREVLSGSAVYRFPISASLMLLSLFLAFKYLPERWVSLALTAGSVLMAVLALAGIFAPIMETAVPALAARFGPPDAWWSLAASDVLSIALGAPVGLWFWQQHHFLANNVLACGLALSAIEFLGLEDFRSGAILLLGLFVYDIFWVFGSSHVFGANVMVTVARKFQGPIKLLFPRVLAPKPEDFSLLGLGDIVIPGLFVALMWRFDEHRAGGSLDNAGVSRRPYFIASMAGYVLAVIVTYTMLIVFESAQPALLYIVPGLLIASAATAAARGELKTLFEYSEAEDHEFHSQPSPATNDSVAASANVTTSAIQNSGKDGADSTHVEAARLKAE
mmetsp:Transcript_9929/g.26404  ORF Transcript_9929/g.26404 Transcript_9929/m.26404 type:complete len:393 (-) Transcript_9929:464-1642(-)